jgi:putative tryptophan/tyrosine transport system substrate-binding protein
VRRRELIALLAAATVARPRFGHAQFPARSVRMGFLDLGSISARHHLWDALRERLRELGYVEGQNLVTVYRSAEGKLELLPGLAAELGKLNVDIIVTAGTNATRAAKQATTTTPIVMATGGDPVLAGVVASLARPGGQVTGVATMSTNLTEKRVELVREVVPRISRIALLHPPSQGALRAAKSTQQAVQGLPIELELVSIGSDDFDNVFSTLARAGTEALIVEPAPAFFGARRQLADLAIRHGLPTVFSAKEYAEAGGLMSYGSDLADGFRRAAVYVGKILKGAKPAELPIEQPTAFELVINMKTARRSSYRSRRHCWRAPMR